MRQQISNLSASDSSSSLTMTTSIVSDLAEAEAYPISRQANLESDSIWNVDSASSANAMTASSSDVGIRQKPHQYASDRVEHLEMIINRIFAKMDQSEARYKMSEAKAEVLEANLRASESNFKLLETNLKMLSGQVEQLQGGQCAPNKDARNLGEDLEKTKLKLNYLAAKHNESEAKITMLEKNTKADIQKIQNSQGEILKQKKEQPNPNNSQEGHFKKELQEIKAKMLEIEKQELKHVNVLEQKIRKVHDAQLETTKVKVPAKQAQLQPNSSQIHQMKKELQQVKTKQFEMEKQDLKQVHAIEQKMLTEMGKKEKYLDKKLQGIKSETENMIKTKFEQLNDCQAEKDKHKILYIQQVKSEMEQIRTELKTLDGKCDGLLESALAVMQHDIADLEKKLSLKENIYGNSEANEIDLELQSMKKKIKQTNLSICKRIASVVKALSSRSVEQLAANEELYKASERGNLAGIWHAAELGANIECRMEYHKTNKGGNYLVHVPGGDFIGQGSLGQTSLMAAVVNYHPSAVELLLRLGASVRSTGNANRTPMRYAAKHGYDKIVKTLLDYGADIEEADTDGTTLLMTSSMNGKTSTVELLLKRGADVKKRNVMGETALSLAGSANEVTGRNKKVIQNLLDQHL